MWKQFFLHPRGFKLLPHCPALGVLHLCYPRLLVPPVPSCTQYPAENPAGCCRIHPEAQPHTVLQGLQVNSRHTRSVTVTHQQPAEQRHKHGNSATEPALRQKGRTTTQPRAEPQLHRTNNTEVHTRVTDTIQTLIHRQADRTYRLTALFGICSDSRCSWPRSEQITWCGTLHPHREPEGRGQQSHRCSLRRTALTPDQAAAAAASFTALHDGENAPLLRRNEQLTNYCGCLDTRLNKLLMRCINMNINLSTCCRSD